LVTVIADVVEALRPWTIVVENVSAFLTRRVRHPETEEAVTAAALLHSKLADRYHLFAAVVDLADYGVPQTRKRAFLTFVDRNCPGLRPIMEANLAPFPQPSHGPERQPHVTLREALHSFGLPPLDSVSAEAAGISATNLHQVPFWADRRQSMVAAIPPNSGRSAWENDLCVKCGTATSDRARATCALCNSPLLRPVVTGADGRHRLVTGFSSSSYRRMHPDRPSSTVTTASGHVGSDYTIHPWENRLLSVLECALLQTFPRDFAWGDALAKWGTTNVREMIGEAVPPHFTLQHGLALAELFTGERKVNLISLDDPRLLSAQSRLKNEKRWRWSGNRKR
jgi:DNA (cytosine-5)-methyltransferase 1